MTSTEGKKTVFVRVFLLLVCIIFCLFSCETAGLSVFRTTGTRLLHYENPDYGVSMDYPADWYFKEDNGLLFSSTAGFNIVSDGGTGMAVLRMNKNEVVKEFQDITPDKVIEFLLNEMNAEIQGITDGVIGNQSSRRSFFTIPGTPQVRGEIHILIIHQHMYIFIALANPAGLFIKNKEIFSTLYSSVEFYRGRE
jgi:hypothetical protein